MQALLVQDKGELAHFEVQTDLTEAMRDVALVQLVKEAVVEALEALELDRAPYRDLRQALVTHLT